MSLSLASVEDAIRVWVKAGSGLDNTHVIFAKQKVVQPSGSFITIKLGTLLPVGSVDAVTWDYDAGRSSGVEIQFTAGGMRELDVTIQAFTAGVTGTGTGADLLRKCLNALGLPSVRSALTDAGLAPFDRGSVQDVSALLETQFESRAVLALRFYVSDDVAEFTGYIQDVTLTDYTSNATMDLP